MGPFQIALCGWPGFVKLFPSPVPLACSWPRKHHADEIINQNCTIYVGEKVQFTSTGSLQISLRWLLAVEVSGCSKLGMLKWSPTSVLCALLSWQPTIGKQQMSPSRSSMGLEGASCCPTTVVWCRMITLRRRWLQALAKVLALCPAVLLAAITGRAPLPPA